MASKIYNKSMEDFCQLLPSSYHQIGYPYKHVCNLCVFDVRHFCLLVFFFQFTKACKERTNESNKITGT